MTDASRFGAALAGFIVALLCAFSAGAAPCGRPDVDATFPPDGAAGVPPNAVLAAHYGAPAELGDEIVRLTGPDGAEIAVEVAYDAAESMLRALPVTELRPGAHVVEWPALRGVATSRGRGKATAFDVGDRLDREVPLFSGARRVDWDLSRERDPCTDSIEDRFVFDLTLGQASDDLDPALLAVVVFETRGPGRERGSAPEQLAVVPMPGEGTLRVRRSETSGGKVCFAAVVRDLVNNVSGGGDREACAETTRPPFFDGCAVSRRRGAPGPVGFAMLGLFCLGRLRRARVG